MARTVDAPKLTGLASRFAAFVSERHRFALTLALEAFESTGVGAIKGRDAVQLDAARAPFRRALAKAFSDQLVAPEGIAETTPGTSAIERLEQARAEVVDACDGFLRRAAIEASLTQAERQEILKGMCLTRSVDNRLKQFFMGGEVRWGDLAFQGKGFRSLGQEAIYAGEWHEAINACAVAKLPAVFCLQNDQTALSTLVRDNSAARVFADKAAGYGVPGLTIDGADPDEVAAAFTWAVERARAREGVTRIEVVARCACAAMPITTTCCTSARISRHPGSITGSSTPASPTANSTSTGRSATLSLYTPEGSRPKA